MTPNPSNPTQTEDWPQSCVVALDEFINEPFRDGAEASSVTEYRHEAYALWSPVKDLLCRLSTSRDQIGAAELAVGRYFYRRLEKLMDGLSAELAWLAKVIEAVEEYGEDACGGDELVAFPAMLPATPPQPSAAESETQPDNSRRND
jgi:hypothetical protein